MYFSEVWRIKCKSYANDQNVSIFDQRVKSVTLIKLRVKYDKVFL